MRLSDQKIDPVKLEQGAWVTNIPGMGDLRLKVRGQGNKTWRKMSAQQVDAVPRKHKVGGKIDPEYQDKIMTILLRDAALLDWGNFEDDDGKQIPFSKEAADKYLRDPEYSRFRDAVVWATDVVAEQGEAEIEEDAKN